MTPSKREVNEYIDVRKVRWFGSVRILPDGRLRYSPWSYLDATYVAIKVSGDQATVVMGGLPVMLLYLDQNRLVSTCFVATLKPDQVRSAVAILRHARHGLDSWVVPALEYNFGWRSVREDPEMSEVIRDLLASCRDLPVAPKWQKVRAQYFINQGVAAPEIPTREDTRNPRGKASKVAQPPRKRSRRPA